MQVEYLKNLVRIDRTLSYNFFLYGKERILTHFESVNVNILPRFFRFVKNETASNKLGNMLNLTKKTLNHLKNLAKTGAVSGLRISFFLPTLTLPCQ